MLWLKIVNDATGDEKTGNYDIEAGINFESLGKCRIEGYHRAKGWQELLLLAALDLNNMEEPKYMEKPLK